MRDFALSNVLEQIYRWLSPFFISPEELPGVLGRAFDYGLKAAVVIAVIMALRRLPLIKQTMHEFNEGRGRIWDLKNTVNDLTRLEPVMADMAARFERLSEVVETIRKQNIEAQIESTAESTGNGIEETAAEVAVAPRQRMREDANWFKLRRYFLRNARRLQSTVEDIPDGRTRAAYDRIGWKRPRVMVDKLRDEGLVTPEAAKASLDLIDQFNAFKPRRSTVPDEVVGAMEVLDRLLELELGPAPPDDELF